MINLSIIPHRYKNLLSGFLRLLVCGFLLLSYLSFNPNDPSLNNTGISDKVTNHAGVYGSIFADIVAQSVGAALFFLTCLLAVTGIKLIFNRRTSFFILKLSFLILVLPLLSCFFAVISGDRASSLISINGGFIGSFIKEELSMRFDEKHLLLTLTSIVFFSFLLSLDIGIREVKNLIKYICNLFLYLLSYQVYLIKKLPLLLWFSIREKFPPLPSPDKDSGKVREEDVRFSINKSNIIIEKKIRPLPEFRKSRQTHLKLDPSEFELPITSMLKEYTGVKRNHLSDASLSQNSKLLRQVLQDFGVNGNIARIHPGPVVTLYELEPSAGTKSSRVIGLADDIARSMSAISARIAVIPGKNALGVELPNSHREIVLLRELLESSEYISTEGKLPLILGKNIAGEPVVADLAKMPHLLVAGTTGSGKSVAINTMILSLLYKFSPKECQFIMIDPKMLELSVYEGIPHLLSSVVTEPKKAVSALKWVVKEMENRYRSMSVLGVRNISGFNKAIEEAKNKGERLVKQAQIGFNQEDGSPIYENISMPEEPLPYIVVIVDEMADLMIVAGKDIEAYIQRLAQMARAAGIHIIMATQRPSVDVITGVIKANFPTRISFQVTSKIDSRTILGEQGAEQLLGMGDMLYMQGGGRIERVHGPFVSDKEVETVVAFLKKQGIPKYLSEITADDEENEGEMWPGSSGDDLYDQAVAIVFKDKRPTTSYIQRCLKIGYNRAANMIERMEKEGILSAPNSMGKREILREG